MVSDAGHDATYLNEITDAAMIFVPSVDGKPHTRQSTPSGKTQSLERRHLRKQRHGWHPDRRHLTASPESPVLLSGECY